MTSIPVPRPSSIDEDPMDAPDERILPERLADHARFVRAVAGRLLAHESDADDAAQEAWVTAIERPPPTRWDPRRWLFGVVRHAVWQRRRSERRRLRREIAAAVPEVAPSASDEVARLEEARRLVTAVMRLDEPYRRAIVLRFWDGLPPREIARRTGVGVPTVKTRLHRALTRLRAELRSSRAREERSYLAALVLLTRGSPAGISSAAIAGMLGGLLVKAKTVWVPALVLLLVGSTAAWRWLAVRAPGEDPAGVAREALARRGAPQREERGDDEPALERRSLDATAPTESVVPASDAEHRWLLRGRLVGLREDRPWTTPVRVVAIERELESGTPRYARSPVLHAEAAVDAAGRFAIDVSPIMRSSAVRRLEVIADDPDYARARLMVRMPHESARTGGAPIETAVEIAVTASASIRGRVVDEAGTPAAGAAVVNFERSAPRAPLDQGVVAADGGFVLRPGRSGTMVVIASARTSAPSPWRTSPLLRPASTTLDVLEGESARTDDLVLRRGASLSGQVRFAGRPIAGIRVGAELRGAAVAFASDHLSFARTAGVLEHASATALTDAQGRYRLDGLAPAVHRIRIESGDDGCCLPTTLYAQPSQVDPPLAPGGYQLEVSMDGFLPEVVPVTVAVGRTAEVVVPLERD